LEALGAGNRGDCPTSVLRNPAVKVGADKADVHPFCIGNVENVPVVCKVGKQLDMVDGEYDAGLEECQ
jgi:hypothetical protein